MKCQLCGKNCGYSIYITREYKKICATCYDRRRKEREIRDFNSREETYNE